MPKDLSKLVKADKVGEHFGVTKPTVLAWARAGRIPFFRPSTKTLLFRISDVEKALAEGGAPQ